MPIVTNELIHLAFLNSIEVYIQVSHRFFSRKNLKGEKITIHITPHEIVYSLGICSYTKVHDDLVLVNDETISILFT